MKKLIVSCPEVQLDEELLNASNPFKKKLRQTRLRCALCEDRRIILGKGVGSEKDWEIVRRHMRIWHEIDVGEDIPYRLLSLSIFKRLVKQNLLAK